MINFYNINLLIYFWIFYIRKFYFFENYDICFFSNLDGKKYEIIGVIKIKIII